VVETQDQAETDRYWDAIVGNGGAESACGWCKDKWGLSWQITPLALTKAITDPDPAVAKRAFDAMMQMNKIDIAAIEAARSLNAFVLETPEKARDMARAIDARIAKGEGGPLAGIPLGIKDLSLALEAGGENAMPIAGLFSDPAIYIVRHEDAVVTSDGHVVDARIASVVHGGRDRPRVVRAVHPRQHVVVKRLRAE